MSRVLQEVRRGFALGEGTENIVKRLRGTKSKGYKDGVLEISRRSAATIARTSANHIVAVADTEVSKRNADLIDAVIWTSTLDTRTSEICRTNDGREFPPGEQVGLPAHPNCRSVFFTRYKDQGTEPASTRYPDWIKAQPKGVQEEALGPTRAALLRKGELDYKDLVNQATREEYTLDQLREREASAFEKVGM